MRRPRNGHTSAVTDAELERLAEELGIDAVGAAPAAPYAETERHIRERRARGLFADMRFTMARPEVSCHPETLLDGARTVVSAALCYYAPAPPPGPGEGRLPRYTWRDAYAELREKLDALGRRLGGAYRVLVDANQHVDREGAVRAGIGFYGKNTMLITRRHGSWVVLGTLVTDVEIEPSAAPRARTAATAGSASTPARPTRSPRPARSTPRAASPTGRRRPPRSRRTTASRSGAMVYGCDICQDVCPWNRGIEKRRGRRARARRSRTSRSSTGWAEADELAERYDRLYVPRNDPRYLRRNALVALGNTGGPTRRLAEPLRRRRRRAAARARAVGARSGSGAPRELRAARPGPSGGSPGSGSARSRSRILQAALVGPYPPGRRGVDVGDRGRRSRSAPASSLPLPPAARPARPRAPAAARRSPSTSSSSRPSSSRSASSARLRRAS